MEWDQFFDNYIDLKVVYNEMNNILDEMSGYTPPRDKVFRMFDLIKPYQVRVIILGQDPYPYDKKNDKHIADGLAFSSDEDRGSLVNINRALGRKLANHKLDYLLNQGVLLLNSRLTLSIEDPKDKHKFWKAFTRGLIVKLIDYLEDRHKLIICAWGGDARDIMSDIILNENCSVYYHCHPSPYNDSPNSNVKVKFRDCQHFNIINAVYPDIMF